MKKILIVDDNANNRMVLNLLLQDYSEERKSETFEIEECSNGLDAFNLSMGKKYDLIFMDIMMPQMDGIEATKRIRAYDKEVMIIAVSAVDDDARQKEILRNGAEDYVPKPLDAVQLYARLDNYFSLLSRRHTLQTSTNSKSVNLYTHKILHRQTIFYVENDEALSEFWEYYLLESEPLKVDGLSDVVRAVYSLGDALIKQSAEPWIIVEADNENIYFTLNKLDAIGELPVKLIMKQNKEVNEFKVTEAKISFKLAKVVSPFEEKIEPAATTTEKVTTATVEVSEKSAPIDSVEIKQTNTDEYEVFDYIDAEDLLDIQDYLRDLSSLMLALGYGRLEEDDIQQIAALLDALGKKLALFNASYPIGQSLSELSTEIFTHMEGFKEIEKDLATMSGAFISDLQTWARMSFQDGAPSTDFMNDTIVANTQTIISMLHTDDTAANESDMDDIFDF